MNPSPSLKFGVDSNGMLAKLGGFDSDGRPVGFIDSDGVPWPSADEAQLSHCAQRYLTSFRRANRHGGSLTPAPKATEYAARYCEPRLVEAAVERCRQTVAAEQESIGQLRSLFAGLN